MAAEAGAMAQLAAHPTAEGPNAHHNVLVYVMDAADAIGDAMRYTKKAPTAKASASILTVYAAACSALYKHDQVVSTCL